MIAKWLTQRVAAKGGVLYLSSNEPDVFLGAPAEDHCLQMHQLLLGHLVQTVNEKDLFL